MFKTPKKYSLQEKILNALMNETKDLDFKNNILKPKQLDNLLKFANYLKSKKLIKVSKLIDDFVDNYYKILSEK